jgi:hypothetical protein
LSTKYCFCFCFDFLQKSPYHSVGICTSNYKHNISFLIMSYSNILNRECQALFSLFLNKVFYIVYKYCCNYCRYKNISQHLIILPHNCDE